MSFNPSTASRRSVRIAALGLAVLAGCAHQDPPGVNAQAISANLVFGVKDKPLDTKPAVALPAVVPVEEPAIASGTPVFVAPPQVRVQNPTTSDGLVELPSQDFPPAAPNPNKIVAPPVRAPRAAVVCPAAALNAFPEKGVTLTPANDSRPELGDYRWKRSGTLTNKATGIATPIAGLEQRKLQNLTELGDSVNSSALKGSPVDGTVTPADPGKMYSFEQVQPAPIGDSVVTTLFKVDTFAAATGTTVNGTGVSARNGVPERGVVIKSITSKAGDGTTTSFSPAQGLLLLPLPVTSGEEFTSAATDPVSGLAYAFQAKVSKRDTVDACGTVLEGWRVDGTMTIAGTTQTTETVSYMFATQYGALPIYEKVETEDATNKLVFEANIGQLHPGAPPAAK